MKIIPVIDLMGGIVVHAQGDVRQHYSLLKSVLTDSVEPKQVVADLLAFYPFKIIYLADLDAIFDHQSNLKFYVQLTKSFPEVLFWIDAGIQNMDQYQNLVRISGVEPIIGSETLKDLNMLQKVKQGVFSLDFQHGSFLGNYELLTQPEKWSDTVIVMNIDHVGTQLGPDIKLLQRMQIKRPDVHVIAAGGVRNDLDLITLEQKNIAGVLIASALHNGKINKPILEARIKSKNRKAAPSREKTGSSI